MATNSSYVATGKAKVSGAIYRAPLTEGLVIPTDPTTELGEQFVCLGFVSEDGMTNGRSSETEDFKDWNGNIIYSSLTSQEDTFKFTLVEVLNGDVLKTVYGDDNVEETVGGVTNVKVTATDLPSCAWVIETVLNGRAKRIVLPNAKVSEVGDVSYQAGSLLGYEVTVSALPDANGVTHYEYIAAA